MPKMQMTLAGLNASFGAGGAATAETARTAFAPGEPLHSALAAHGAPGDAVMERSLREYLRKLPPALAEALRATIHTALSASPPTAITFAWAPAYDYELHVWQALDTDETPGGITVLIKSRYPADAHPNG